MLCCRLSVGGHRLTDAGLRGIPSTCSLMVRYVEASFDGQSKLTASLVYGSAQVETSLEDYIQTLGVNFMEKTVSEIRTRLLFCRFNSSPLFLLSD